MEVGRVHLISQLQILSLGQDNKVLDIPISKPARKILQLLPLQIGPITIQPLSWQAFQGEPSSYEPYSAHIYWGINYEIVDPVRRKINAEVICYPRSWVRSNRKCDHLLNHEQGHYLIGALCMLEFIRRIHTNNTLIHPQYYQAFVARVFQRTRREFLDLERRYDIETQHRLKPDRQAEWDMLILKRLKQYKSLYNPRKGMFRKKRKRRM